MLGHGAETYAVVGFGFKHIHHLNATRGMPMTTTPPSPMVEYRRWIYDRGPRPITRGWFHLVASWCALVSGSVLSTYAFIYRPWPQALGVLTYAIGVVALFGVSAAYHRGRWKTPEAVAWWRRADHATIGVFIASTYTPLCLIALPQSLWVLYLAWAGAAGALILSMVWITHPRWLAASIYIALGWLITPLIPALWRAEGPAVVWLLFIGGIVYSAGAIVYAMRWPGRNATIMGYHEIFHAATIVAAIIHLVAIWMVVVPNAS